MYIVDSGASIHMMGSLSLNNKEKNTLRPSSKMLDIQTAIGIVVSDTQVKVDMKEPSALICGVHLVDDSPQWSNAASKTSSP